MPILNYRTEVSADKTIGEIQELLRRHSAQAVTVEYEESRVKAVAFRIHYQGNNIAFLLPSKVDRIMAVLHRDRKVDRRHKTREHAERVAWRIMKDWLQAQLALVEAEQVELIEVFLPYAQNPQTGRTIFEDLKQGNFDQLALPAPQRGSDD